MQVQENTKMYMYMYNFSIFVSKNFGLLRKFSALWVFCLLFCFCFCFLPKTYTQFGSLLIHFLNFFIFIFFHLFLLTGG